MLFSGKSIEDKFSYIDTVLYSDPLWRWMPLAIYPALTAMFFLFVYPYPAKWVYEFWRNRQKDLKEIRQKIEDETPLTIEESRIIRRQMVRLRAEYEQEIRNAVEVRDELKESESELRANEERLLIKVGELEARNDELETQLDAIRIKVTGPIDVPSEQTGASRFNVDIQSALLDHRWRLFFNPEQAQSKIITFKENGVIEEGRNKNEASWRIVDGHLELVQVDGQVHSRFNYIPQNRIFAHTGDPDTKSIRGQYIIPEAYAQDNVKGTPGL